MRSCLEMKSFSWKYLHYWVILASDFIPQVLEVITNPERHSRSHLSSLARHKMKTWKEPKPENITEEIREKEAEK